MPKKCNLYFKKKIYGFVYVQEISGMSHQRLNSSFDCRKGLGVWDVQAEKGEIQGYEDREGK